MYSKGTGRGKGVSVVGGNSDDDDFVDPPSKRTMPVENPKGKGKAVMGRKSDVNNVVNSATARSNKGGAAKGIQEPELKNQRLQTRNSPTQMTHAMQNLSVEQSQLLDRIGFGEIRRLKIKELPGDLTRWLILNFDAEKSCLKMRDYDIPINKIVLNRIFGLPCGGKPIRLPSRTHLTNSMVKKWRHEMGLEIGSVNPQEVAHDIVQNNDVERLDWFLMQFVVLFSATMLGSIKDGACNLTILHAFNSTSEIGELDWCEFIVSKMIEAKQQWSKSTGRWFSGPLTFLAVLYCEMVECKGLEIQRTDSILDAWTSEVIRRRVISELDEGGLGLGKLIPKYSSMGIYKDQRRQSLSAEGSVSGASSSRRKKKDSMGEAGTSTVAGKGTGPVRCSQRKKTAAGPDMQTAATPEKESPVVKSPARVLRSSLREETVPVMCSPSKKKVSETKTTGGTGMKTPEKGGRKQGVGRKLPPSWAFHKFDDQENITVEDEDNTEEEDERFLEDVLITPDQFRDGANNKSSAQRGKTRFLPHRRAASTAAKRIRVEVNALNSHEECAAPVENSPHYSSDTSSMNEEEHDDTMDEEPQQTNWNYEEMVDNVIRDNPVCNVESEQPKKVVEGSTEPSKKSGTRKKHTAPAHVLENRLKRQHSMRGLTEEEIAIADVRELAESVKTAFLDYVCVSVDISLQYPNNMSLQQIDNDLRDTLGLHTSTPMTEDVQARQERGTNNEGPAEAIFSNNEVAEDAGMAADSFTEINVERKRGVPSSFKSPFVMRTVDVNSTLPKNGNLICNWLFSLNEEPSHIVWMNGKLSVPRVVLESLEEGEKVISEVLTLWALHLNFEERLRSQDSPSRVFLPISISMNLTIVDEDMRYEAIGKAISLLFSGNDSPKLKDFNMIFVPMLGDKSFYLMVLNLKHPAVEILEAKNDDTPLPAPYGNKNEIMRQHLVRYLQEMGYVYANDLNRIQIKRVKMKWGAPTNEVDDAIAVMRMMETYMGGKGKEWQNHMAAVTGKQQSSRINKLRKWYLYNILNSEVNEKREFVLGLAKQYDAYPDSKKLELIENRNNKLAERGRKVLRLSKIV